MKGPYDSTGFPVGCRSACVRFLLGYYTYAFADRISQQANLDGNPSKTRVVTEWYPHVLTRFYAQRTPPIVALDRTIQLQHAHHPVRLQHIRPGELILTTNRLQVFSITATSVSRIILHFNSSQSTDPPNVREQLPQLVRICLRRVERHRLVDL